MKTDFLCIQSIKYNNIIVIKYLFIITIFNGAFSNIQRGRINFEKYVRRGKSQNSIEYRVFRKQYIVMLPTRSGIQKTC
jgi:hypothetical protein